MIYYLIHQSPIWSGLPNGKRNVRILFLALALYIVIHAISYELKDMSVFFKIINGYFFWFLACDIFISSCIYRLYYGRSIFGEIQALLGRETDTYDDDTHTYHKKENEIEHQQCAIDGSGCIGEYDNEIVQDSTQDLVQIEETIPDQEELVNVRNPPDKVSGIDEVPCEEEEIK